MNSLASAMPIHLAKIRPSWTGSRDLDAVSNTVLLAPPAQFGVPDIAQRIAKEIEAQDRQTDSQAGKDGEPGSLLHKGASGAAQHQPPGRRWRLRPQA